MDDQALAIKDRMITYEDHHENVDEIECSMGLKAKLKKSCREIVAQIKTYQYLNIISGNFFFQSTPNEQLYLIFVTSVRVDSHTQGLNGMRGVTLVYHDIPKIVATRKLQHKHLNV